MLSSLVIIKFSLQFTVFLLARQTVVNTSLLEGTVEVHNSW